MLNRQRLVLLFLTSLSAIAAFAQSAPAKATGPEKLSLNDAIQRALAKNFSIKVVGLNASIAAAGVTESLGKFDPVLNGNYRYSTNTSPAIVDPKFGLVSPAGIVDATSVDLGVGGLAPWGMTYTLGASSTNSRGTFNGYANNYSTFAGINGTQPLLRDAGFGATLTSIRIARTNRNISEWQYRQAVIDTVTNVIFAYNDLDFAYASRRSAIRSRDLAAGLLAENEQRFKVGDTSQYDVTSARSRTAGREDSILAAEHQVTVAENALKQLITDTTTPALLERHLLIEPPPPAPLVLVDPAADFRIALEKRPDYQQAKLVLKRNGLNARLQRNQLLPRVDLVGSYGYNGNDTNFDASRAQVRNQDYRAYSYGVVLSVPLSFTTERGRYRAARMQENLSATEVEQVEQNIVVYVGNAADQIVTGQKRVEATRKARELAQATLDAEVKRLHAGQSSTFIVAQQQEILSAAEVIEALAQSNYQKALADYDRQLGVTLEKLNITVQPPR